MYLVYLLNFSKRFRLCEKEVYGSTFFESAEAGSPGPSGLQVAE